MIIWIPSVPLPWPLLQNKISCLCVRSALCCNVKSRKGTLFQTYLIGHHLHLQDKWFPALKVICHINSWFVLWVQNREIKLVFLSVPKLNGKKQWWNLFSSMLLSHHYLSPPGSSGLVSPVWVYPLLQLPTLSSSAHLYRSGILQFINTKNNLKVQF